MGGCGSTSQRYIDEGGTSIYCRPRISEAVITRTSGILLHPTSLPGPLGIGDLGPGAHRFVDLLVEMGQVWWQMLPTGPTGYGDSPYQSPSTFAGNPLLVSPELLVQDGLLDADAISEPPPFPTTRVDFGSVIGHRMALLAEVADRFDQRASPEIRSGFEAFVDEHGPVWLDDFCLFTAIKRHSSLRPWWEWDKGTARRRRRALKRARNAMTAPMRRVAIEQFLFDRHFRKLRDHARESGVRLIGDIPIFVAHDSADVWANRHLFYLDKRGLPTVVAGVPPDYFSVTGQRWGNPLYAWDRHEGYEWWTARMRRAFDLFDLVRVDHFRGFCAYWAIPASCPTAVEGEWIEAPGMALFEHLEQTFEDLPVIAEDLGVITPDVEELRDRFAFPGMKILQFGFGTESTHSPEQFRPNVVAYTGTHDNDTAVGWFNDPSPDRVPERATALEYLHSDGTEFHWDLIEAVLRSVADTAIVPLQDVLGLGSGARMNTPGTDSGNWQWRFDWPQLGEPARHRMRSLTIESNRRGPR